MMPVLFLALLRAEVDSDDGAPAAATLPDDLHDVNGGDVSIGRTSPLPHVAVGTAECHRRASLDEMHLCGKVDRWVLSLPSSSPVWSSNTGAKKSAKKDRTGKDG